MKKETPKRIVSVLLLAFILLFFKSPWAAAEDETKLMKNPLSPEALIVLDLSGSMDWNPAGGTNKYGDPTCSGTFYSSEQEGYNTNCTRLEIAKRAIFNILDYTNDAVVNSSDKSSLNVQFGYMRFKDCTPNNNDKNSTYSTGCNSVIRAMGDSYSLIYCGSDGECSMGDGMEAENCVNSEKASGGTPLAVSLKEAKEYHDARLADDKKSNLDCRKRFVILITDGDDTLACCPYGNTRYHHIVCGDKDVCNPGYCNGQPWQVDQYKRRRESVARAKALTDAGYKLFVIGFGSNMPDHLKNTLNWMAYYGGTDNPKAENTGSTGSYLIPSELLYPSGIESCTVSSTKGTCDGASDQCFAETNDPGSLKLSGYAFVATNYTELRDGLRAAVNIISEANYSFSQISIQPVRSKDENFVYQAAMNYNGLDPFWRGHLYRYAIDSKGYPIISATAEYAPLDAGYVLKSNTGRNILTYISGSAKPFSTDLASSYFGVSDTVRNEIVSFIKDGDTFGGVNWKLGDIYHSSPVTISSPSIFYVDSVDQNNAFETFRTAHQRTSTLGNRLIVVGANDGQVHAFKTTDMSEAWSIVPPNLLPKLKLISHVDHPTGLGHHFFVDGQLTVANLWLGSGDGKSKKSTDWKTYLLFGLRQGGNGADDSTGYLWSSSATCDSGMAPSYSATAANTGGDYSGLYNYCGYYAFDVTGAENATTVADPVYKWNLHPGGTHAPYFGEPFSKVMVGRVRIGCLEKWVGFIGGGYDVSNCKTVEPADCVRRGKGFFVFDMNDGRILWSFNYDSDQNNMQFSIPATPAIVDTDNDGYVDTVYVGDLGSNMWRFKLCTAAQTISDAGCTINDWTGKRLYARTGGDTNKIFTLASVSRDTNGTIWVYWGTGDQTAPVDPSSTEKFCAVMDKGETWSSSDLDTLSSENSGYYTPSDSKRGGWCMQLSGKGEKVLYNPIIENGVVHFTTYLPAQTSQICTSQGTSRIYSLKYISGEGTYALGKKYQEIGKGIDPGLKCSDGGIYGGAPPEKFSNETGGFRKTNVLYWKDRRLEHK